MIRVGLTGNIGCGKSTVLAMLRDLGAEVIDADHVVHELVAEAGGAVTPVLAAFPEASAEGGRTVDRPRLGAIVFADEAKRHVLEDILHPLVWAKTREAMAHAERRGAAMFVVEATMLFESALRRGTDPRRDLDVIVAVTCDEKAQRRRVTARTGTPRQEPATSAGPEGARDHDAALSPSLRARLAAQMPQDEKARLADRVVDNSGDREDLMRQVRVLHSDLLAPTSNG